MAVSVLFTVRDDKGAKSLVEHYLPDASTLADASAWIAAAAPVIDTLIKGVIERAGVCVSVALPGGLRTDPLQDSDVEEGARFIFGSVGGYTTSVRLPTFNEGYLQANSNLVDLADASVQAYVDGIIGTLGGIAATDYRGASVNMLKSAREDFQRSRKRIR